jgi:hypothetical protein
VLVMPTVWFPKLRFAGESEAIAPCTTWYKIGEVLGAKFASPLYVAVMLCVPTDRVEVVKVAIPPLFRLELPMFVVPS